MKQQIFKTLPAHVSPIGKIDRISGYLNNRVISNRLPYREYTFFWNIHGPSTNIDYVRYYKNTLKNLSPNNLFMAYSHIKTK